MLHIKIDDLPENVSMYQAVENCYSNEVRFIWSRLKDGMSVLIRCEKQIIPYLQLIIKKKLTKEGKQIAIIDGRSDSSEAMQTSRINKIVNHFRDIVYSSETDKIFLLPYLDIITSIAHGALSMEGKEIMTIIHENPFLVLAAFEDPDFPIPDLIAQAFPAKTELVGIPRNKLHKLITRSEARKFAEKELNVMELYKYISGLNPVKLRQIMQIFDSKADYNVDIPEMSKEYFRELREYTATGNANLSGICLDRDIAGYSDVKDKIRENILGLLERAFKSGDVKEIEKIEGIIPKGIIFQGPPGTGKTLFAKGIAEAINATVHIVSGPELKSKWVGQGEANIRRLFARARSTAPSVIVFDEIDSIASHRSGESDGGAQAHHSMVNQLLTELDGFRKEELIFVVGTTNFVASLDEAFLRPGRFEYQIEIGYPKWEDRRAILSLYNEKLQTNLDDKDLDNLADWTERPTETFTPHTGDHLNAIMRNLKRHLINKGIDVVTGKDLISWLNKKSKLHKLSEKEEKVVAIHEIGHALMYHKYNRVDEIKRITIESGLTNALGMVEAKRKDLNMYTQSNLCQEISICLGGYSAEKIVFGEYSTGASQDLVRATFIAEDMVKRYGMGNLGVPRSYLDERGNANPYFYNVISPQVDAILIEILKEVTDYLTENKDLLNRLCENLLQERTLDKDQFEKVLQQT